MTLEEEQKNTPDDPLGDERCGFTRNEMEGNPPLSQSENRIEDDIEDKWLKG